MKGKQGMKLRNAPLRTAAFVALVLVTGATSVGCTSAAGKVSTPTDAPVVSSVAGWSAFLDWATTTTDEGGSIMDTFTADATAYDVSAIEGDAHSLYSWADDARSWLAANPPDSCYASVHASYDRTMAHYQKAGKVLMGGATTKNLNAATAELKLGNADVGKTTALVEKVSC